MVIRTTTESSAAEMTASLGSGIELGRGRRTTSSGEVGKGGTAASGKAGEGLKQESFSGTKRTASRRKNFGGRGEAGSGEGGGNTRKV